MDARRWADVETIFTEVLELRGGARADLLALRCAGDRALQAEIESLLAAHDVAGDFLSDRTSQADDAEHRFDAERFIGRTVGSFRLTALIGEGGMGAVYRGERVSRDFAQQVAVKVLRPEAVAGTGWQRFRVERQALASLDHPYVVRLIDGFAQDGCACLVMELVEGLPITEYGAQDDLSIDQRLALFQRVCAGVQGAHRHGVLHRDLKPTNILVTAEGLPKILDFGVAKLLDAPPDDPNQTAPGMARPLTPNYASPEQLRGESGGVTTDVYALGVVLYELVAGVRPYDAKGKSLGELVRTIEAGRIVPLTQAPSSRLASLDGRRRALLDAIVVRAMHPDAARRHHSVEALADEVGRYLAAGAVAASTPTPSPTPSRGRRLAVVGVIAAALVGAVIAGSLGSRDRPVSPITDPPAVAPTPSSAPSAPPPATEPAASSVPPAMTPTPVAPIATAVSPAAAAESADLTRRGLSAIRLRQWSGRAEGMVLLRRAVDIDPQSAPALAALAEGLALSRVAPERAQGLRHADRAVSLAPRCAECLAARGFTKVYVTQDWAGAKADLRRAIALNPRIPMARGWLATVLSWTGDSSGADETIDLQLEESPGAPALHYSRAAALFFQRAFEPAIAAANRTMTLDPSFRQAIGFKWMSLARLGRAEEVVRPLMNDVLGPVPQATLDAAVATKTTTLRTSGLTGLVSQVLRPDGPGIRRAFFRAVLYSMIDRPDDVLRELEAVVAENDTAILSIAVHPYFDPVRSHPRFLALVERVHLSEVNAATLRRFSPRQAY